MPNLPTTIGKFPFEITLSEIHITELPGHGQLLTQNGRLFFYNNNSLTYIHEFSFQSTLSEKDLNEQIVRFTNILPRQKVLSDDANISFIINHNTMGDTEEIHYFKVQNFANPKVIKFNLSLIPKPLGVNFDFKLLSLDKISIEDLNRPDILLSLDLTDEKSPLLNGKLLLTHTKFDKNLYEETPDGREFYDGKECHFRKIFPYYEKSSFLAFLTEIDQDRAVSTNLNELITSSVSPNKFTLTVEANKEKIEPKSVNFFTLEIVLVVLIIALITCFAYAKFAKRT